MLKNLKNNKTTIIALVVIFFLAFFLRAIKISEFPVGFQTDEAILGYTGYSIIHTWKDTNGVFLPMYTEVFGDYIPTGYHYLTIPPIIFFGLNEFSTRLPSVTVGSLMIFSVYFLAFSLLKNKTVSLLSAFFLAISPWSIILSRGSSEAMVSVFFVTLGFAFLFQSIRNKKTSFVVAGACVLFISFFFYHTPRLFIPLMLISTIVYLFLQKNNFSLEYRKVFLITSIILILIVALLVISFKGSTARFNQISIWSFPEMRLVMEEQIREDGGQKPLVTRYFHNKIINSSLAFVQNYSEYFSINNLFFKPGLPRMFSIPNTGLIYAIFIPFFFYGIFKVLVSKDRTAKILIIWILVAPITAALTVDDVPNMRRASVLYPVIEIISVYGLILFLNSVRKINKLARGIIYITLLLLFIWSFIYFVHQYFVHGKKHQPWHRNNGMKELMDIVNKNYDNFDKIIITKDGVGYPLVLFYSQYSPEKYIEEGSPKDADFKGFGKYIFVPSDCPSYDKSLNIPEVGKILYVDRGTCKPPSTNSRIKFKEILREDGSLGFRVIY